MLDKLKNLYNLKQRAGEMQKKMAGIYLTVEDKGVKVTVRGDQHLEEITIDGEVNNRVKDIVNRAMRDVQKKAAKKVQGDLGDLGIPGL